MQQRRRKRNTGAVHTVVAESVWTFVCSLLLASAVIFGACSSIPLRLFSFSSSVNVSALSLARLSLLHIRWFGFSSLTQSIVFSPLVCAVCTRGSCFLWVILARTRLRPCRVIMSLLQPLISILGTAKEHKEGDKATDTHANGFPMALSLPPLALPSSLHRRFGFALLCAPRFRAFSMYTPHTCWEASTPEGTRLIRCVLRYIAFEPPLAAQARPLPFTPFPRSHHSPPYEKGRSKGKGEKGQGTVNASIRQAGLHAPFRFHSHAMELAHTQRR